MRALRSFAAAVLAVALIAIAFSGCGPARGREVSFSTRHNLQVTNNDSENVTVSVAGPFARTLGDVAPGETQFYWVDPGTRDLRVVSDRKDENDDFIVLLDADYDFNDSSVVAVAVQ